MSNRKEAGMIPELERVRQELLEPEFIYAGEKYVRVETAEQYGREVQSQTVEATASWLVALGEYLLASKLREEMLSPAQEVRNG